jgi:N-acetylglucosaminyldiphosphoundecaprenol N-acetyl-beta-D-mannosaminyltransferase
MGEALQVVDDLIAQGKQGSVFAVNPEKVIRAKDDPALLAALKASTLLVPDGIGVVSAARLLGLAQLERVPGVDLMLAICARAAERGYRLFLYGARPDVNERARAALLEAYPDLKIVGCRDGYAAGEESSLVEEINASGADVLFVGLGSPKQEFWVARNRARLRVAVCQGIGGTLDVVAGAVRRAPQSWRKANLEWAYRLLLEPVRIRRHAALPRFAWRVLASSVGRTHPSR